MKKISYLLDAYDETAWKEFSQCFEQEKCPVEHIQDDMWSAMKYLVSSEDDTIFMWLEAKVPALGGLTPAAVLKMPNGEKMMRSLLMRMPC